MCSIFTQLEKYMLLYESVSQSSPNFCRSVLILCSKHARKRFDRIWKVFVFVSLLSPSWLNVQSQPRTPNETDSVICYPFSYVDRCRWALLHPGTGVLMCPLKKAVSKVHVLFKGTRVSNEHAFWTLSWTCVLEWLWTLHWSKAEQDSVGCLGDKASSSGAAACPLAAWSPVRRCNTSLTRRRLEYLSDWGQYHTYITTVWL